MIIRRGEGFDGREFLGGILEEEREEHARFSYKGKKPVGVMRFNVVSYTLRSFISGISVFLSWLFSLSFA